MNVHLEHMIVLKPRHAKTHREVLIVVVKMDTTALDTTAKVYVINFYGKNVLITLLDINECWLGLHNCHAKAACFNLEGSFKCTCKDGFRGNGIACEDVNECLKCKKLLLAKNIITIYFIEFE